MIAYTDILILPYDGQNEPQELTGTSAALSAQESKETVAVAAGSDEPKIQIKAERKTASIPTGKLASSNIGIKSTLNPPKKKGLDDEEALPESHEAYTQEDLMKHWNDYAYKLKNANRDGLFTTLTRSEMSVSSGHVITLKIKNHQVNELEAEKIQLLRHLRFHLKNTNLNLVYKVEEAETVSVMDSKATFDKLAEENESLKKFRKMFNLDIEF